MKTRCYAMFLAFLACTLAMPLPAAERDSKRVLRVWEQLNPKKLKLRSKGVLITDDFGNTLYAKDPGEPRSIASLTKLMTAMVILDAELDLDDQLTVTKEDRDLLRLTGSRLGFGARLTRRDLLTLALMSSENRAARALARSYPGGMQAFVRAMNAKAQALHMYDSQFADPAGLDEHNVASPADLVRMVNAASHYPLIRKATTRKSMLVHPYKRRGPLRYVNTNRLLRNSHWDIRLSKTGYINEAGRCLVMRVNVEGSDMVMVFLDSFGKLTPFGDANRTLKWLQTGVLTKRTQVADAGKAALSLHTAATRPNKP